MRSWILVSSLQRTLTKFLSSLTRLVCWTNSYLTSSTSFGSIMWKPFTPLIFFIDISISNLSKLWCLTRSTQMEGFISHYLDGLPNSKNIPSPLTCSISTATVSGRDTSRKQAGTSSGTSRFSAISRSTFLHTASETYFPFVPLQSRSHLLNLNLPHLRLLPSRRLLRKCLNQVPFTLSGAAK